MSVHKHTFAIRTVSRQLYAETQVLPWKLSTFSSDNIFSFLRWKKFSLRAVDLKRLTKLEFVDYYQGREFRNIDRCIMVGIDSTTCAFRALRHVYVQVSRQKIEEAEKERTKKGLEEKRIGLETAARVMSSIYAIEVHWQNMW